MSDIIYFDGQSETGPVPPSSSKSKISMCFKIHRFADLPHERDDSFQTDEIKIGKYSWGLEIYPRGDGEYNEETEYLTVYLHRRDCVHSVVTAKTKFACSNYSGTLGERDFYPSNVSLAKGRIIDWGVDLLERFRIFDPASGCLDENGTLTINVTIDVSDEKKMTWYPELTENELASGYYLDAELSDVSFLVENESFSVHRFILRSSASALYEIAKDHSGEGPVSLDGVKKKVFAVILKSIYTIDLCLDDSNWEDVTFCEDALTAADRFGVTNLKLLAESVLADIHLKVENAAHMMILANSYSCPLLAEAASSMYAKDPKAFMNCAQWQLLQKSPKILQELLVQSHSKFVDSSHKRLNKLIDDDIESMNIGELRDRLQELDTQLDGTRNMLVKRLKDKLKEKYCVEKKDETEGGGGADQDMNAADDAMDHE